jgi:hypothetical protein
MRCEIPQPCIGSNARVFRISRSSVPCNKSAFGFMACYLPSPLLNRARQLADFGFVELPLDKRQEIKSQYIGSCRMSRGENYLRSPSRAQTPAENHVRRQADASELCPGRERRQKLNGRRTRQSHCEASALISAECIPAMMKGLCRFNQGPSETLRTDVSLTSCVRRAAGEA